MKDAGVYVCDGGLEEELETTFGQVAGTCGWPQEVRRSTPSPTTR